MMAPNQAIWLNGVIPRAISHTQRETAQVLTAVVKEKHALLMAQK